MTPDEAFVLDIVAGPDGDAPRLIYADWLEDHGLAERAELIRVQVEWARMAVFNDRRRWLHARQRDLLAARGTEWLLQEWPLAANADPRVRTFERGFVAELSLWGRGLGDRGVRAVATSPRLALLTALDLRENKVGAPGLLALADSPYAAELRLLDLRDNPFRPESARVLATSAHLNGLREMVLPRGAGVQQVEYEFRRRVRDVAVHTG
jgi:uncharacterized protein (TIGR02996 family)